MKNEKLYGGLVPSLYTSFDFKHLESCFYCVKRRYGPSIKSVWEAMCSMFALFSDLDTEESVIQTSKSTFQCQCVTHMGILI